MARCEAVFHPLDAWAPNDWATALAGEVGELCNLLKKVRRGETIEQHDIADEIADVQTYLDLLAARLGVDLAAATIRKFNRVSEKRGSKIALEEPTPADVERVARAIHDANGNWTCDPTVTWDNRFDMEYPKALSRAMARAAIAAMGNAIDPASESPPA